MLWAARQGLQANPHSHQLYLLWLRAAIARGEPAEPDAVYQHYRTVTTADDGQPDAHSQLHPAIVKLYETYRQSQPNRWTEKDHI